MQYALDNLFTVEAGMRDERVPKAMFLYFYKANPEDNVRAALEEARRRGIQVSVLCFLFLIQIWWQHKCKDDYIGKSNLCQT